MNWKIFRILEGVAKHVQEDGLGEVVEEGDDLAALGTEGIYLLEDRDNSLLLCDRRERDP